MRASSDSCEFQSAFFQRVQPSLQLLRMFEYLPDVDFFVKDAEGRFVAASARTLRRVGLEREEELIGKRDDFIHPPGVAIAIRKDDRQVMKSREPLVDRVEALYARNHAKDWFLTTKLPVFDGDGTVIGVMGYVRPYRGGRGGESANPQIARVIAYIHKHFAERMTIGDLARIAHLSERQLNRRFQETFRMSPQEFLVRTRVQVASDALLESDKSVAEIAVECGFCDQSAFAGHFRKHIGESPAAFRRRRTRGQR